MFVPAVNLQDQIERAIMSMPSKQAARPNLVGAEALKTAPTRQAGFWPTCGQLLDEMGLFRRDGRSPLSFRSAGQAMLRIRATTAQLHFSHTRENHRDSPRQRNPFRVRIPYLAAGIPAPSQHRDSYPASNTTSNPKRRLHCHLELEANVTECSLGQTPGTVQRRAQPEPVPSGRAHAQADVLPDCRR